jgi:hypothetical protein
MWMGRFGYAPKNQKAKGKYQKAKGGKYFLPFDICLLPFDFLSA